MRISDWSSDVCSSDLHAAAAELDEDIPRIEPVVDCGMLGVAEEGRINTSIAQAQGLAIDLNRSVLQRSNEIVGRVHQREQVAAVRPALAIGNSDERFDRRVARARPQDRKSTRLNSSH